MKSTHRRNGKAEAADTTSFASIVGRGLRRSAVAARKVARAHGMPIYVWKNGRIVAIKP